MQQCVPGFMWRLSHLNKLLFSSFCMPGPLVTELVLLQWPAPAAGVWCPVTSGDSDCMNCAARLAAQLIQSLPPPKG